MKDPSLVSLLEEVFERQRNSFIRYVFETSQAEVRDDMDRRVMAFYEDWHRQSVFHSREVEEVLSREEVAVRGSSYPIEFSQFNYLSPSYLLKHVTERMGEHLDELAEIAARLAGWPLARDLVQSIVASERKYLDQAKKLEEGRPKEAPKPSKIKGTSASRW